MTQRNKPRYQTRSEKRIEQHVENVPKSYIILPYLPQLRNLIAQKSKSKYIQHNLNEIQISGGIDRVDGGGVEAKVDKGEDDLGGILVDGCAHSIGIDVSPVGGVVLFLVVYEFARVILILDEPASPEIVDAFLVP